MFEKPYVQEFFNQKELLKMLEIQKQGKKPYGRKIYTIYCFLIWYKKYFLDI